MFALLAAEEGGAGNGFWLPHDINEVIWGTLAFLIIVGLLYVKAWPAIKTALAARPERIAAELDAASSARTEAEAKVSSVKDALADSDKEAAQLVADARDTAKKVEADMATRATAEAEAVKERGVAEIAAARRQAEADLTSEISRLALGAAERVVESNLNDATQQDLIESYIGQVGANN